MKTKASAPCSAKDLYRSPLFAKQRAYAERMGVPWYILSAEFGLVAPDDWLAPYERYLPDTPASYRAAWGAWVVERLALLHGDLRGMTVEIHASAEYLGAIRSLLQNKGAMIVEPLAKLQFGQRLAWYDAIDAAMPGRGEIVEARPQAAAGDVWIDEASSDAVGQVVARLLDQSSAITPASLLSRGRAGLNVPGIYSWWVDREGAADLTEGLGETVAAGLLYAGLAGATRWPSGKRSRNTLWSRLAGMHLGNRADLSTLRLTLGSILGAARGWNAIDEGAVTGWMHKHLKLVMHVFDDADHLGRLEARVLEVINPPLNLSRVPPSSLRRRLSQLRGRFSTR